MAGVSRRAMMGLVLVPLSGCGQRRVVQLTFQDIEYLGVRDDGFGFRVVAVADSSGPEGEPSGVFRDVELVGFGRGGGVVCQAAVGTLDGREVEQGAVEVVCSAFPYGLTFRASPSPCEAPVEIMIAEYRGLVDGEVYWRTEQVRECGDLPLSFENVSYTPPGDEE